MSNSLAPARGRSIVASLGFFLGLLCLVPTALAQEEEAVAKAPKGTPVRVAVAPFSGDSQGERFSSIAVLLAARLRSAPRLEVVDPSDVGAPPAAEEIAAWAEGLTVNNLITGNVVRLGERTSVHARLRSGQNGAVLETFVEEIASSESAVEGVDRLGSRVLAGLERVTGAALLPKSEEEAEAEEERQSALGVSGADPLQVESEELEVIPGRDGGRRIVFTRSVEAEQGRLRLQTDTLEAIYPAGASEPERFVATGNVRMREQREGGDRSLLCERATYFQAAERLVCTGKAELQEGEDRVRGNEIEILFRDDIVKVRGGAILNLSGQDGE